MAGTISGNCGLAGATVSYADQNTFTVYGTVTADVNGDYATPSLADSTYLVAPSLAGHYFAAPFQQVVVSGSNVTGVNFTSAVAPTLTAGAEVGSDDFLYADGPVNPAKWGPVPTYSSNVVVGHKCVPPTNGPPLVGASYYTGALLPSDMYIEFKVGSLDTVDVSGANTIEIDFRETDALDNWDSIFVYNNGDGTYQVQVTQSGAGIPLFLAARPAAAGDVFRLYNVSNDYALYQNGSLIANGRATNSRSTGTNFGSYINAAATQGQVGLSNFAFGNASDKKFIFTPTFTESFVPDSNPLNSVAWEQWGLNATAQALSGVGEGTTIGSQNGNLLKTTKVVSTDQYCKLTVEAFDPSDYSTIILTLRSDLAENGYQLQFDSTADGSGKVYGYINRFESNSPTDIGDLNNGVTFPLSVGDTIIFAAIGSILYVFINDILVFSVADSMYPSGRIGFFIQPPTSLGQTTIGNFIAGSVSLGGTIVNPTEFAQRVIPGNSTRDYLHLLDSLGNVVGWIDPNGLMGGTLGSAGASAPTQFAQLTLPDAKSNDYLQLLDAVDGKIGRITSVGAYSNTSGGTNTTQLVLQNKLSQDFLQVKDSTGAVIGWIDYTGALQGTLAQ